MKEERGLDVQARMGITPPITLRAGENAKEAFTKRFRPGGDSDIAIDWRRRCRRSATPNETSIVASVDITSCYRSHGKNRTTLRWSRPATAWRLHRGRPNTYPRCGQRRVNARTELQCAPSQSRAGALARLVAATEGEMMTPMSWRPNESARQSPNLRPAPRKTARRARWREAAKEVDGTGGRGEGLS